MHINREGKSGIDKRKEGESNRKHERGNKGGGVVQMAVSWLGPERIMVCFIDIRGGSGVKGPQVSSSGGVLVRLKRGTYRRGLQKTICRCMERAGVWDWGMASLGKTVPRLFNEGGKH